MRLKNLLQYIHNEKNNDALLHLKEAQDNPISVSRKAPPAFLTQTPLGTTHEETNEEKIENRKNAQKEEKESLISWNRSSMPRQKSSRKSIAFNQKINTYGSIHHWIYEDIKLSMSKMSIVSLIFGLLFLGVLFFIIGFLTAVSIAPNSKEVKNVSSAWQDSNQSSDNKFIHGFNAVGAGMANKAISSHVGPLGKVLGAGTTVVPKTLQPFARYGTNAANAQVQTTARSMNPFLYSSSPYRTTNPAMMPPQQPMNSSPAYYGQPQMQHPPTPMAPQGTYLSPQPNVNSFPNDQQIQNSPYQQPYTPPSSPYAGQQPYPQQPNTYAPPPQQQAMMQPMMMPAQPNMQQPYQQPPQPFVNQQGYYR